MAGKLKPKATTAIDVGALKRTISDINNHKMRASESAGAAGKTTQTACEMYGFNKKALGLVAGLAKKEPPQQLEVLGAIVSYAHQMGMFDGSDMFNDHIASMQAVIDAATAGKSGKAPAGASNVSALVRGDGPVPVN